MLNGEKCEVAYQDMQVVYLQWEEKLMEVHFKTVTTTNCPLVTGHLSDLSVRPVGIASKETLIKSCDIQ